MSTAEWLRLLKAFLVPAEPMNQIASVVQADWMTNAAYLPLVGIVFALAYAMRKKDWLGRILKICAVIAVVPVLNNMFMFFGVETYRRWYYMFILLLALATAKVLEQPEEYPVPAATGIWAGALLLFYVLTNVVKWSENEEHVVYKTEWYYRGILIAIAGVLIALFIVRFWEKKYRTQALTAMTMLFSAGTLLLAIRGYQVTTDNSNLDFKTYPNSYAENVVNYMTEIPGELDRDVLPYRYYFDEGIGHTYYNLAMTASLPSINSFISTIHPSVMEFYDAIGIGRGTWTNAGTDGLPELLSARYIVSAVEQPDDTYISTFTNDNGQEMYYYENERALPIGFAYDTYMTKSQFEQIDPQLRAMVMLTTLVVDDADVEQVSSCLNEYTYEEYGGISLDRLDEVLDARRKESSESFTQGKNYFISEIHASGDRYAFFSVPYDECWRASVNGESREVININGLMAVRIDAGDNTIRFDYVYTPLKQGIVCSIAGVLLFAGYMIYFSKKKNSRSDRRRKVTRDNPRRNDSVKKTGLFLAMTGMVLSVMVTPFSVLADVQTEELPTGLLPVEEIAIKADDSELYESSDELLSETALYYAQIYDSSWDVYKNYYVYNQLSDAEKSYWDALDAVCMKYLTTETDANTDGTYNYLDMVTSGELGNDEMRNIVEMFRHSNPQY